MEIFVPSKQDMKEYTSIRDSQMEYIEYLERQLDDKSMRLVASDEDLRNKLQVSVSKLDIGRNDENLGELCELDYLPRSSNQKESQNPYIGATLKWTRNEEYIKSLEWQIDNVCSSPLYECEQCGAMFLRISKLKYHRNKHHVSRQN